MRSTAETLTLDRRSLLDAALDAIISIDAAVRVLEFNPSAERTGILSIWFTESSLGRAVAKPRSLR